MSWVTTWGWGTPVPTNVGLSLSLILALLMSIGTYWTPWEITIRDISSQSERTLGMAQLWIFSGDNDRDRQWNL